MISSPCVGQVTVANLRTVPTLVITPRLVSNGHDQSAAEQRFHSKEILELFSLPRPAVVRTRDLTVRGDFRSARRRSSHDGSSSARSGRFGTLAQYPGVEERYPLLLVRVSAHFRRKSARSREVLSPDSPGAPGSGMGAAACSSSWTQSAGSARESPHRPCRSHPGSWAARRSVRSASTLLRLRAH
jgi:hypothetical protein